MGLLFDLTIHCLPRIFAILCDAISTYFHEIYEEYLFFMLNLLYYIDRERTRRELADEKRKRFL